jgi:hypothetical protein
MLALNGIFLLVTRHGLEYPPFYRRLYTLLTQEAFAAKHRAQVRGKGGGGGVGGVGAGHASQGKLAAMHPKKEPAKRQLSRL